MARRQAFTLIELLTVIAIIGLLAAITFPVFSRVKDSANRSSDASHMNALRTAIGLYAVDQGGYPPALLGYVTLYSGGGSVIPADQLKGYLYPRRVGYSDLKPAYNRFGADALLNDPAGTPVKPVVFPNIDSTAGPIFDANGDGVVNAGDDTAGARQAYGPADGSVCWSSAVNSIAAGSLCSAPSAEARRFYAVSGYDVAEVPTSSGGRQFELHYARFWTKNAIGTGSDCGAGAAACGSGSALDDPRQLGYNDPPDDTVVTWNSYFREYTSPGVPARNRLDLLLTLGGSARTVDSKQIFDFSWRQRRTR